MQTTTAPAQTPDADITGILADLAAVTDRLVSTVQRQAGEQRVRLPVAGGILASTSRLTAAAVEVLSAVTHRGVIADEGLTIGSWLRSFAGCTIADERMLDNTANRLADMPTLRRWFGDGTVSWSIVRGVVYAVRNLTKAQRRWVDDALAGDADRVRRLGPDELVAAVERLADQARPDLHRDREQRAFEHEFFRLQLGFDGTSFGTFALNAEDTQTLINALRNVHPDTGTTDAATGGNAPAAGKPTMFILADLAALTGNGDGVGSATAQLLLESTRGPVELTHSAAQRLACDANWRIILTDGAQILGASATHPNVSATLRAALVARDGGCRWPGCRQPAAVCVNHHWGSQARYPTLEDRGGLTILENVALLCEAHHHTVHDGQWANTLHPDGAMTFTRRGITLTSLPRGEQSFTPKTRPPNGRPTRRRRPPDPEPHPADAPNQPPPEPDDLPF